MAPKTRDERLFGAACLKVTLERNGGSAMNEIYTATLSELGLTAVEVEAYLLENRPKVREALDARGRKGGQGSDV